MKDKDPKYDFHKLGNTIADTLILAAQDQVTQANNLLASTKALAEGIQAQMNEQAKLLDDMTHRLNTFGASVLDAHHKFINGKDPTAGPSTPQPALPQTLSDQALRQLANQAFPKE